MPNPKKYRLAIILSHPIHYFVDLYKELNKHPEIEVVVYFCSDFGIKAGFDETFGKIVKWYDESILEGLPHKFLKNYSPFEKNRGFWSLFNPAIINELKNNKYDAVLIHGYARFIDIFTIFSAKLLKIPVILRGESHLLNYRSSFVKKIKDFLLPLLFKQISAFAAIGTLNKEYCLYYGVPEEKIFIAPYSVNNDFFQKEFLKFRNKKLLKKDLGLNPDIPTILYVSKMIQRKRPMDLLLAFERLLNTSGPIAQLAFVGDGPQKIELENYSAQKGLNGVHFFGFRSQIELPKFYSSADIFTLPSSFETWGLVINEAMNFKLPIIASDAVGAAYDIVKENKNGFIHKVGEVEKIYEKLDALVKNPSLCKKMGGYSKKIIDNWSHKETIIGITKSIKFIKNQKVIVAQAGSHHLWQTAVGLQKENLLKYYATGIYYDPKKFPYFLFNCFSEKIRNRIILQLKRRSYAELNGSLVKTFGLFEWFYILNNLTVKSKKLYFWIIKKRNQYFSKKVGFLAKKIGIKYIWAGMDSAMEAFEIAKKNSIVCILDQFIGHPKSLNKIIENEEVEWLEIKGVSKDKIAPEKLKRLEKEIELADFLIAGSEFVKETLLENGAPKNKIKVIPYGADLKLFENLSPKISDGKLNLLFVGNISIRKGCHYLLEAMKKINSEKIQLTMIGEMESDYFLKKYNGLFKWIKAVPHSEIAEYFNKADVYVYPSLFEGSSLSIYEALAAGLPVITTHNSGSIIRDKKDGFIVPIKNSEAIAEKILLFQKNKVLLKKISKNAKIQSKKYSWKNYQKNTAEFIKSLINKNE